MDAIFQYRDANEAAVARSSALRWMVENDVMSDLAVCSAFGIDHDAVCAVVGGAPLVMSGVRAEQVDRVVAIQSLLLDGYSPERMAIWLKTGQETFGGRSAAEVMSTDGKETSRVLEAAAAWMS